MQEKKNNQITNIKKKREPIITIYIYTHLHIYKIYKFTYIKKYYEQLYTKK